MVSKKVKAEVTGKQIQTDCALKGLQETQRNHSKNLTSLERDFETFQSTKEMEERRAERRSRAQSSLEQSLEDQQSLNEVRQSITSIRTMTTEGEQRLRLDSGISVSSLQLQKENDISLVSPPPTDSGQNQAHLH